MKQTYVFIAVIVVILFAAYMYARMPKGAPMSEINPMPTPDARIKPPAMEIDPNKSYTAVLTTTEGPITIALTARETPITVNNFVHLSRKGFYDSTVFHRTIPTFMIQGGDPKGNGTGGPGYSFDDEPFNGKYTRGTVAMANSGPNTNGSQFFIMHQDYDLPPAYVIFGHVTDGMGAVDAIASAPTKQDGRENSKPVSPVSITSVAITEK